MGFNLTKDVPFNEILKKYKKKYPNVFKHYKLSKFYIFGNIGLQLIPLDEVNSLGILYNDFETLRRDLDEINEKDGVLEKHKLGESE
ncbi:hypothetical protein [Cetobacterium sp.]|uniref:hypothetical protein n=1 Tax=Cetobacterium sp. TaxID=2071632 RepID=UPI003F3152BA